MTDTDLTAGRAFLLGAAGGSSVLATFVAVAWVASKLLGHIDRIEERWFREQEAAVGVTRGGKR